MRRSQARHDRSQDASDAVCAELEHETGAALVGFLPYVIRPGSFEPKPLITNEVPPRIFPPRRHP